MTEKKRFDLKSAEKYSFGDLVEIIAALRAPGGCPWDIKQTHQSLKECLVEESGEVIDAIDNDDDENLCEELGDVLLQVVMHAQIAAERGSFTIDDVVQGVSEKMIRRHPNVFANVNRAAGVELTITMESFGTEHKNRIIQVLREAGYDPVLSRTSRIYM